MLGSYVVFGGTFMLSKAQDEASESQGTVEQWFILRQIWYPKSLKRRFGMHRVAGKGSTNMSSSTTQEFIFGPTHFWAG
jgi:hypothetical protein